MQTEFPVTLGIELVLDGPEKPFELVPVLHGKRKRSGLMKEEISIFTNVTTVVKEVATAIRESKTLDVHRDLYGVVVEQGGFNNEALMATLGHLLDNKARGVGFVAMADAHRVLWLRRWVGKHYY
ncbi:Acetyl-coenzyme A synthetase [Hordeum vulgare]|nr:Acetyl-coenzyme A synthetase [Hordeum vulgare]